MHLSDTTLILSATDLSKFLSCTHLTLLDRPDMSVALIPVQIQDPQVRHP